MTVTILIIGFVCLMALWGLKLGFIRSIFQLGYYIISAIVAAIAYPPIAQFMMKTSFATFIHDKIILNILQKNSPAVDMSKLPSFIQSNLEKPLQDGINSAMQTTANTLTHTVISIICIIIVFLIVKFGLNILVNVLDIFAKLPVISAVNKLGGIIVGAVNGIIIVYLALGIISLFIDTSMYTLIESSSLASKMYNNNILIKTIFH